MKGSEILISALIEEEVDTIFGVPGGAVLDIYDSLYHHPEIKHILTSHEQGAAHGADGYARASGKVGVCLATSGPGATNLITGIATAYMDSIPMVAITGNVSTGLLGKDSFQEVDIFNVTMPVTKHNFIVKDVTRLSETIHRAFSIAKSGRPGPVLVDITSDVLSENVEECPKINKTINKKNTGFSKDELKAAARMINSAKKPLLYVGGGAIRAGAYEEVEALSERLCAPVCDTLMGKGAFSGTHRNYLGMLGIHGTEKSREAIKNCDLLIAIGARFSDRATENFKSIPDRAKVIHIDIDPAEINKNIRIDLSLIGDCKIVLNSLLPEIREKERQLWIEPKKEEVKTDVFDAERVIRLLNDNVTGKCFFVTDVGQHQMLSARHIKFDVNRRLLTSGGLGTMGFGLPAGIGAALGQPDTRVFVITGDGSFRMNMNELVTAVNEKLPITVIILNNSSLGLVKELQRELFDGHFYATELDCCADYTLIAKGMGAEGVKVSNEQELLDMLKVSENKKTPFVIECKI